MEPVETFRASNRTESNSEKRFQQLENTLRNVSNSLIRLEKKLDVCGKEKDSDKFSQQLANNVPSVVGLQELVSSRGRITKFVWALLLLGGFVSTCFVLIKTTQEYLGTPTATKMDMQDEMQLPPIVICPIKWYDTSKAEKLGFSHDALQYAMGYMSSYMVNPIFENISQAKQEFLDAFYSNNFTNIIDFYINISIDLKQVTTENYEEEQEELHSPETSAYKVLQGFKGWHIPPKKVFSFIYVCHEFSFPIPDQMTKIFDAYVSIFLKLVDKTKNLLTASNQLNILFTMHPENFSREYVTIDEFTTNTIATNTKIFKIRDTSTRPCYPHNDGYYRTACIDKCKHGLISSLTGCTLVNGTTRGRQDVPITSVCNWFEPTNYKNFSMLEMNEYIKNEDFADSLMTCSKNCLRPCTQIIHDTSIRLKQNLLGLEYMKHLNISAVSLAFYTGTEGTMVIEEVETYTLTSLITAVGGTLGLFVGCTVMTFAQVILFIFNFLFQKCHSFRSDVISDAISMN